MQWHCAMCNDLPSSTHLFFPQYPMITPLSWPSHFPLLSSVSRDNILELTKPLFSPFLCIPSTHPWAYQATFFSIPWQHLELTKQLCFHFLSIPWQYPCTDQSTSLYFFLDPMAALLNFIYVTFLSFILYPVTTRLDTDLCHSCLIFPLYPVTTLLT